MGKYPLGIVLAGDEPFLVHGLPIRAVACPPLPIFRPDAPSVPYAPAQFPL
jgi:hypothetical protein